MTDAAAPAPATAVADAEVVADLRDTVPPPLHAVALLLDVGTRSSLRRALHGHYARLSAVMRVAELLHVVETDPVDCLVTELRDEDGAPAADALAVIRRRFPDLPIVLYVAVQQIDAHEFACVSAVRPSAIVVRWHADLQTAVVNAMTARPDHPAVAAIRSVVAAHAPHAVRGFLLPLAQHAARPICVAEAARAAHTPRRTLGDRLRRKGLPTVEVCIGWMRVLHALWRLDSDVRSTRSVVREMQFPSQSALQHMVRRYTGHFPGDVRVLGGFDWALGEFARVVLGARRVGD